MPLNERRRPEVTRKRCFSAAAALRNPKNAVFQRPQACGGEKMPFFERRRPEAAKKCRFLPSSERESWNKPIKSKWLRQHPGKWSAAGFWPESVANGLLPTPPRPLWLTTES